MNVERFQDVIARLRLVPPNKFDMDTWMVSPTATIPRVETLRDESCDTIGCVLGWCCVWYPEWTIISGDSPKYGRSYGYLAAASYFSISVGDSLTLFSVTEYRKNVTPDEVADALEAYVKNNVNRSKANRSKV